MVASQKLSCKDEKYPYLTEEIQSEFTETEKVRVNQNLIERRFLVVLRIFHVRVVESTRMAVGGRSRAVEVRGIKIGFFREVHYHNHVIAPAWSFI